MKRIIFLTLAILVLVSLLVVAGPSLVVKHNINNGYHINLKPPLFIQPAYALENPGAFEIGTKLDAEAGISAYTQTPDPINLSLARNTFTTIELDTSDYIIGSVSIPNYVGHFDTHVYVHKDGWILAYYLNTDPVGKIVDAKSLSINSTKLYSAIATVAGASGVSFTNVFYYDFRYPNATNMLFVARDSSNGGDYTITLPSSYGYYERGWAISYDSHGHFAVDGINLSPIYTSDTSYGTITASQLIPNTPHTIFVWHDYSYGTYGVLVIEYRVP